MIERIVKYDQQGRFVELTSFHPYGVEMLYYNKDRSEREKQAIITYDSYIEELNKLIREAEKQKLRYI